MLSVGHLQGRGVRSGTLSVLERTHKVVVFGGGSFGTAVGTALARQKSDLAVSLLLRDPYVCKSINDTHRNLRYLAVSTDRRHSWRAACTESPHSMHRVVTVY